MTLDNPQDPTTDDYGDPLAPPPPPFEEDDTLPPPPPAPDLPTEPLTFEAGTWYQITATCTTTDAGSGERCINLNRVFSVPMVYSVMGEQPGVACGLCQNRMTMLSSVRLDPQPEPE